MRDPGIVLSLFSCVFFVFFCFFVVSPPPPPHHRLLSFSPLLTQKSMSPSGSPSVDDFVSSSLLSRLGDEDPSVLQAVLNLGRKVGAWHLCVMVSKLSFCGGKFK